MFNEKPLLGWVRISGAARDRGRALGRVGHAVVHRHLTSSLLWAEITAPRHAARVARMAQATRLRFPAIWAEIKGLAEGLELPVTQVMAWNCRGDLLACVPDGCTTVMIPGTSPTLAHNEDGLPFFRGTAFIAEVTPEGAPGFTAFCYPGSIPGHTFAFNDAGLAQAVNNLRFTHVEAQIPRMVLGRAVLGATSLDYALSILKTGAASGGFHFALSFRADPRILSVEFGAGEVSVREITEPAVHTNHALHHGYGLTHQIITRSSHDRQRRGTALLTQHRTPLDILRDTGGEDQPIRRDAPDDPDEENTLATVTMTLKKETIIWSIHDRAAGWPAYQCKPDGAAITPLNEADQASST